MIMRLEIYIVLFLKKFVRYKVGIIFYNKISCVCYLSGDFVNYLVLLVMGDF